MQAIPTYDQTTLPVMTLPRIQPVPWKNHTIPVSANKPARMRRSRMTGNGTPLGGILRTRPLAEIGRLRDTTGDPLP